MTECSLCKKELSSKQKMKLISCQDLNFCHGKDCDCGLTVGSTCYANFKKKIKVGNAMSGMEEFFEELEKWREELENYTAKSIRVSTVINKLDELLDGEHKE